MLSSLRTALRRLWKRKGLVVLIYAIPLAAALVLAALVGSALEAEVAATGFGDQLASRFEIGLWANIMNEVAPAFRALLGQLLWLLPLYALWSIVSSVGLIHALRGKADGSFWRGVERFTGRGVLLALLFALPLIGWLIVVGIASGVLNAIWDGEVAVFWTNFVMLPILLFVGLAAVDLMHDCARIALVANGEKVTRAWRTGMAQPFQRSGISYLYVLWLVPAVLFWAAPFFLDGLGTETTWLGLGALFLGQQVALLLRAATTVGWLGSAVAFFEAAPSTQQVPTSKSKPSAAAA